MLGILVIALYILVKSLVLYTHHAKAINIIFAAPNWDVLDKKYFGTKNYLIRLFNPFWWTFNQMFRGLK